VIQLFEEAKEYFQNIGCLV